MKRRRLFMKQMLFGALAAMAPRGHSRSQSDEPGFREKRGSMYYRRLGRTGLSISEISLGGSPLPDWPLLLETIERGVNYIDTSCTYQNGNGERMIGRLFKEVGRDKFYVGTKFHLRGENWSENSIIDSVNGSLKRLNSDHIDVLLIHGAEKAEHLTDERVVGAFEKLKKEGKYMFRGLSCHSNHHQVVKKAVDSGFYDMVQVGYNVFDIDQEEKEVKTYGDYLGESGIRDLLALAGSKDVGVIAMKTLKVGGRRQNLDKYRTGTASVFQAMLKWVLENRNVSSAVTEMLNHQQLEEDLTASGQPLSDEERRNLFLLVAENSKDYCHMCALCQNRCPASIETASILRCLAYAESYGKERRARELYSEISPDRTAASCRNCGECEKLCPYSVSVRKRIREAERTLRC